MAGLDQLAYKLINSSRAALPLLMRPLDHARDFNTLSIFIIIILVFLIENG